MEELCKCKAADIFTSSKMPKIGELVRYVEMFKSVNFGAEENKVSIEQR